MVHIHAEGPAFFCWLPKLFGKRVVVTIHGIDWQREKWQSGLGSKFIHQGEKNAVKYADEVIVLSKGVVELNDMTEMRSGKKSDMALLSDYLTVSGTCFINQSSPVITISKNGIRFSKACHTRLDDCEHVELLYHPILQVVILRKSNRDASTAIHWENKDKICSSFSSRAFSGVIFEAMNWKWSWSTKNSMAMSFHRAPNFPC